LHLTVHAHTEPLEVQNFRPHYEAERGNDVNLFNFQHHADFSHSCGRLLLLNKELLGLSDLSIRTNHVPHMEQFMLEMFNHMDRTLQVYISIQA